MPAFKSAEKPSSQELVQGGSGKRNQFFGLQVALAGRDFVVPSPVCTEDVAFPFCPSPFSQSGPQRLGNVSTMSLKGETELGGMKREAGRGLKGPEVLGGGGFRRGSVEGKTWVRGQRAGENRSCLGLSRAPGIWFTCPHGQLPRPLRHTLNICVHWCQLPLAGLGHSCGGLTGQAGLNIDSQGGRAALAGTAGSKGRRQSRGWGLWGSHP